MNPSPWIGTLPAMEAGNLAIRLMITTLTRHLPDRPLSPVCLLMMAALLVAPVISLSHIERQNRQKAASEYASNKDSVLNSIGQAVAANDLSSLRDIQKRFSPAVKDREFVLLLDRGMAEVTAKSTEEEMNIAKHLDLARNREESSMRLALSHTPDIGDFDGERLSVLPQ